MDYLIVKQIIPSGVSDIVEILVENKNVLPDPQALRISPGSIAYTADLSNVWQLDLRQQWVAVISDEG